jgi:hypothetical protein
MWFDTILIIHHTNLTGYFIQLSVALYCNLELIDKFYSDLKFVLPQVLYKLTSVIYKL